VIDSPEDMTGVASTPAENHLVTVNNQNPIQLNMMNNDLFHHFFAKLWFFVSARRTDTQTAVDS